MFSNFIQKIRQVIHRMIPYKDIESAERIETPLSNDMINALDKWHSMYLNDAPWLGGEDDVKSLNLPAFISSEIARCITLEMEWNITGTDVDQAGNKAENPRSIFLKKEAEKLFKDLRRKLEQGCAGGGLVIKPYVRDGKIFFNWVIDWSLYPVSFGDDGDLTDVIFPDVYVDGKDIYTRLERHTRMKDGTTRITQRAFKSNTRDSLGTEISLSDVPRWAELPPEAIIRDVDGQMFGWFKVAAANNVDIDSPMGISVFSKSEDVIREADEQYSRLLWEYEGSELAIDVDPTVMRARKGASGTLEMPKLKKRLFRKIDLGTDDHYNVFSPAIRDVSLVNGLNELFMRIEDLSGMARGTISNVNDTARTATELKIMRQRTYATISDNQKALERCLQDVIRAMDRYATIYKLAPEGEYEVSFVWDDSVITDSEQQMNERMVLYNIGAIGLVEMRMWYLGETKSQAQQAIAEIAAEKAALMADMQAMVPTVPEDDMPPGGDSGPPAPTK